MSSLNRPYHRRIIVNTAPTNAEKAWKLGSHIRDIYQAGKTVDERIRNLEIEVIEFARTCRHVHGRFQGMPSTASSGILTLAWDEDGALTS